LKIWSKEFHTFQEEFVPAFHEHCISDWCMLLYNSDMYGRCSLLKGESCLSCMKTQAEELVNKMLVTAWFIYFQFSFSSLCKPPTRYFNPLFIWSNTQKVQKEVKMIMLPINCCSQINFGTVTSHLIWQKIILVPILVQWKC
jgi:hypothetical protein